MKLCLRCGYPVEPEHEEAHYTPAGAFHSEEGCSRRLARMRSDLGRQRDERAARRPDPARSIDTWEAQWL